MKNSKSGGLNRRTFLRGTLGGAAISVGLPFLDIFLNTNGNAMAATGAPTFWYLVFWLRHEPSALESQH